MNANIDVNLNVTQPLHINWNVFKGQSEMNTAANGTEVQGKKG